ncbi:condensation domain-containing protein, partial [Streptomyces tendae]|uniref:condensation domain-containing protein n=1 Tax=Streptomyces tendae TaxID=1932 RepID=UPI00167746BE
AEDLPEYMIPAAFVPLEALPLTHNGKLDRTALPVPELTGSASSRAPRTDRERALVETYADVLGVSGVGIDDSFFDLGGDSIVSIQLVSRARRAGVVITPRDVFTHKTVAALAVVARDVDSVVVEDVGAGVGVVAATPIVRALEEVGGPVDGFYQSMLVVAPVGLVLGDLTVAVQGLLDRHDALRMRVVRGAEGWVLEVLPVSSVVAGGCVRRVSVEGLAADAWGGVIEEETGRARARLAPESGVMLDVVWFDAGPGVAGRVLLVVHHLAVDGVSWRVLVPDLAVAWEQVVGGGAVVLESVPTSLRTWSGVLTGSAGDPGRVAELGLWQGMVAGGDPLLGVRGLDPVVDVVGSAAVMERVLPAEVVGPLLTTVPAAFRAGVNDVLLTALSIAVGCWRDLRAGAGSGGEGAGSSGVLIDLEGHGREEVGAGLDVSRTVGWFTSTYPVRLVPGVCDPGDGAGMTRALKAVKEQLRRVPDHGIGWGLLRYVNPETRVVLESAPVPQIGFNYLGRFPVAGAGEEVWSAAPESAAIGSGADPGMPLGHVLELNALTEDHADGPRLVAYWSWAGGLLGEDEVCVLADLWFAALRTLADPGTLPSVGALTPSDLPLIPVSQGEIEELEASWAHTGVSDILPLSPLQDGLLFHALYDQDAQDTPGVQPYFVQLVLELEGPLDAAALRAAGQGLLNRHANLRAAFVPLSSGRTAQLITRTVELPWVEVDLTAVHPDEQRDELARAIDADQLRPLDLAVAPLLRFTLLHLGEKRHVLLISHHHVLWDGWSLPVMLGELFALYGQGGEGAVLPRVTPFRDYLQWLAVQDREAAESAWRENLAGLEEPTRVAPSEAPREPGAQEHLTVELDEDFTTALTRAARAKGVTLNTVVQAAWAILLARMTGRQDVVFGATVSGRPAELPGVEDMVGLFINTLPVRVKLDPAEPLAALLTRLQDEQAALTPHQHLGLADLHRLAGLGELFDTATVFENYPMDPSTLVSRDALRVTDFHAHDATHFPLGLTVLPGARLSLQVSYRPEVFGEAEVRGWSEGLRRLLDAVVGAPATPVGRLDALAGEESVRLLEEWSGSGHPTSGGTLVDVFAQQVARTPEASAVVFGDRTLSFAELNGEVNRLARLLIGRGAGPGRIVATVLPRSAHAITTILAVLTSGAAYVPVDPDYPADRIAYILSETDPVLVATDTATASVLPSDLTEVFLLDSTDTGDRLAGLSGAHVTDADRDTPLLPSHPAFVIYTSGSTGRPKGVSMEHRSVVNLFEDHRVTLFAPAVAAAGKERFRVALTASLSFDATWAELLWMFDGHELHLVDDDTRRDAEAVMAYVADRRIDLLDTTPSFAEQLVVLGLFEASYRPSVLLLGGEAVGTALWETLRHSGTAAYNFYGPTETTVEALFSPLSDSPTPVIGRPVWNTRVYVLDAGLLPVPVGVAGELYIAGSGLARGYV